MSTNANLASTLRAVASIQVNVANANRDGTGTITQLIAGAASGTLVPSITAKAQVTTTAGMIRIFRSSDAGVTWRLWKEIAVTAATPSATVLAFEGSLAVNCVLPNANHTIGISTEKAETFNVYADSPVDF